MRPCATAFALGSALALLLGPGLARAGDTRSFDLDHLELALTSPEFLGVEGAGPLRPWAWQVGAAWRFTNGALMADGAGGESRALVGTRSLLDVGGGVALGRRFGVGVELPVLLVQGGELAGNGAALGDLRLVGRANLFDIQSVRGALLVGLRVPTGDTTRFLGEGGVVVEPRVALGWRGGIARAALNLGARLRGERTYGDLVVGNEAFASAAIGVRPARWLDLFGEAHLDTAISSRAFDRPVTPVELLAGAGGRLGGFALQAAMGFGVVDGFGSPNLRVLIALSYSPEPPPPPAPIVHAPPKKPPPPPPPVELAEEANPPDAAALEDAEAEPPEAPDLPPEKDVKVDRDFMVLADPVYFDRDKARVRSRFHAELEELARALNARPFIRVLWIEGHTDDSGPVTWNQELSERRARRVANFLVEHGVSPERVRTLASGQTKPWFSNTQREGREKNRRVTFFIEREESGPAADAVAGPAEKSTPPGPDSDIKERSPATGSSSPKAAEKNPLRTTEEKSSPATSALPGPIEERPLKQTHSASTTPQNNPPPTPKDAAPRPPASEPPTKQKEPPPNAEPPTIKNSSETTPNPKEPPPSAEPPAIKTSSRNSKNLPPNAKPQTIKNSSQSPEEPPPNAKPPAIRNSSQNPEEPPPNAKPSAIKNSSKNPKNPPPNAEPPATKNSTTNSKEPPPITDPPTIQNPSEGAP